MILVSLSIGFAKLVGHIILVSLGAEFAKLVGHIRPFPSVWDFANSLAI